MAIVCPQCESKETSNKDSHLMCHSCGQRTHGLKAF